jgi:hypothetical protein
MLALTPAFLDPIVFNWDGFDQVSRNFPSRESAVHTIVLTAWQYQSEVKGRQIKKRSVRRPSE